MKIKAAKIIGLENEKIYMWERNIDCDSVYNFITTHECYSILPILFWKKESVILRSISTSVLKCENLTFNDYFFIGSLLRNGHTKYNKKKDEFIKKWTIQIIK